MLRSDSETCQSSNARLPGGVGHTVDPRISRAYHKIWIFRWNSAFAKLWRVDPLQSSGTPRRRFACGRFLLPGCTWRWGRLTWESGGHPVYDLNSVRMRFHQRKLRPQRVGWILWGIVEALNICEWKVIREIEHMFVWLWL